MSIYYNSTMQKIKINDSRAVSLAVKVLKNGGIVMHPTETCYGLAASISNKKALAKLYKVKAMSMDKPVSILVADFAMAQEYGVFSSEAVILADKYWPGPLSILIPRKKTLPAYFNPGNEFVSMRVSSLSFCRDIVKGLRCPITTTSANKSGQRELYTPKALAGIDLLIDGGEIFKNKPSTIVKIEENKVEILRQGDLIVDV